MNTPRTVVVGWRVVALKRGEKKPTTSRRFGVLAGADEYAKLMRASGLYVAESVRVETVYGLDDIDADPA